jgi:hypothetical protein
MFQGVRCAHDKHHNGNRRRKAQSFHCVIIYRVQNYNMVELTPMYLTCVDKSTKHVALGQHITEKTRFLSRWSIMTHGWSPNPKSTWMTMRCELDMNDHCDASTALDTDGGKLCRSNVSRGTFQQSRYKVKLCKIPYSIYAFMSHNCPSSTANKHKKYLSHRPRRRHKCRVSSAMPCPPIVGLAGLIPAHVLPLPE